MPLVIYCAPLILAKKAGFKKLLCSTPEANETFFANDIAEELLEPTVKVEVPETESMVFTSSVLIRLLNYPPL